MLNTLKNLSFAGNSLLSYIIFLSLFLGGSAVIKIFLAVFIKRFKKWAQKTATTIDDFVLYVLERIIVPALYFAVFYAGTGYLYLGPYLRKTVNILGVGILTVVVVRVILALINYGLKIYLNKIGKNDSLERSLKGMLSVSQIIIWGMAIVFFLDNLGFKISSVIAGLGIGGVAVALAAQAVLGDVFSYFSILFDRPFEVGDFIIIGDYLGSVEYIGIKTTRIRSLSGEQLIFANTDLTNSRVRNYKRMGKRRVLFKLGVVYQTSSSHLKEIPRIIKDIIGNVKDTVFDRAHFFSYGDFSLNFEIVYYVMSSDYNKYMDIQQEINFAIKEEFEKRNIEFAYPTQTLYLDKGNA